MGKSFRVLAAPALLAIELQQYWRWYLCFPDQSPASRNVGQQLRTNLVQYQFELGIDERWKWKQAPAGEERKAAVTQTDRRVGEVCSSTSDLCGCGLTCFPSAGACEYRCTSTADCQSNPLFQFCNSDAGYCQLGLHREGGPMDPSSLVRANLRTAPVHLIACRTMTIVELIIATVRISSQTRPGLRRAGLYL